MYQNYPAQHLPQEKKHSGVGIVSFVISILNGLLLLVCSILSATMASERLTENDPGFVVLALMVVASLGGFIRRGDSRRYHLFPKHSKKSIWGAWIYIQWVGSSVGVDPDGHRDGELMTVRESQNQWDFGELFV